MTHARAKPRIQEKSVAGESASSAPRPPLRAVSTDEVLVWFRQAFPPNSPAPERETVSTLAAVLNCYLNRPEAYHSRGSPSKEVWFPSKEWQDALEAIRALKEKGPSVQPQIRQHIPELLRNNYEMDFMALVDGAARFCTRFPTPRPGTRTSVEGDLALDVAGFVQLAMTDAGMKKVSISHEAAPAIAVVCKALQRVGASKDNPDAKLEQRIVKYISRKQSEARRNQESGQL